MASALLAGPLWVTGKTETVGDGGGGGGGGGSREKYLQLGLKHRKHWFGGLSGIWIMWLMATCVCTCMYVCVYMQVSVCMQVMCTCVCVQYVCGRALSRGSVGC